MSLTEVSFYGNSLRAWAIAAGVALATGVFLRVVKAVLLKRAAVLARRTSTAIDDLIVDVLQKTRVFFIVGVSLFVGTYFLTFPEHVVRILRAGVVILLLAQTGVWGGRAIRFYTTRYAQPRMEQDPGGATTMAALAFVGRLLLWTVLLLLALDNVGVDVTALIAGLGIGGIAAALALQNVLSDLFASLAIVLDKPFVVGDIIAVGELAGTVEHVGLKTTRLRSLSGEELIFGNNDLLQSRIRNYERMEERQVRFTLSVTYATAHAHLAAIPEMLRAIVAAEPRARFDRAHFRTYGDFALQFEVVYWVLSAEYRVYMDVRHAINLEICRVFRDAGITFAYPTQTLLVERSGDPAR